MRIWHKDLIQVLPDNQLFAQWRTLNTIRRTIMIGKNIEDPLISPINEYDTLHLMTYGNLIKKEFQKREYDISIKKHSEFWAWCIKTSPSGTANEVEYNELFREWHNGRYFKQCFYCLQELYDRNVITEKDWENILTFVSKGDIMLS